MTSSAPPGTRPAGPDDLRCRCGSLMARLAGGSLELKCRRCKRIVVVKLHGRMLGGAIEPASARACEACGPFEVVFGSG
ncbi:MAG: hypothetical protein HY905_12660 [Deltaproteobacteria bacterium]|nr:hypothetical protein [Deltaproteobacteria bacterium]